MRPCRFVRWSLSSPRHDTCHYTATDQAHKHKDNILSLPDNGTHKNAKYVSNEITHVHCNGQQSKTLKGD